MTLPISIPKFLEPALYNDHRVANIVAARRTGKTYNAAQWIVDELFSFDISEVEAAGIWVDTTQSNIDKYVEREFAAILSPIKNYVKWDSKKKILRLDYARYIDFGSAERPENLEGRSYARSVLNESGIILKKDSLWNNTLEPMFKESYCKVRNIGTPKGKNKFWHLSRQYPTFHFTAYDSPFWDKAQLDEIKTRVPLEVWQQEYLAMFLDGAGSVFRNIVANLHTDIQSTPRANTKYVMAIDLAKYQDFTVITIGEKNEKRMVYMERFNHIDWQMQKERIIALWIRFGRPHTIIDSTGVGDAIFEDLQRVMNNLEGYKFTNASKNELIRGLSVALDQGNISVANYPELISELELFEYTQKPSGAITYSAPSGYHDDCVISLALLNYLMQNTVELKISFI